MKALYTTKVGDYGLVERPKPVPAADEALVKVAYSGLCHTDVTIREKGAAHVRYPVIPGHEFAGVVEECGSVVKYIKPGDRVAVHSIIPCGQCPPCRKHQGYSLCENIDELGSMSDGGFAPYCVVPGRLLVKAPDHLPLSEVALTEPLANAINAVQSQDIRLGERVAIIGPGAIGLMAVQVARLANPSVLVLVGTRDERLTLGKQFGATHTVNIKKEGALEELKDILDGKGADVTIECAGTISAVELAQEITAWRGRIALEGTHDVGDTIKGTVSWSNMMTINGWSSAGFQQALELIAGGLVKVKPLITHTFPLEEWETAFDMVTKRKSECIKVQFAC